MRTSAERVRRPSRRFAALALAAGLLIVAVAGAVPPSPASVRTGEDDVPPFGGKGAPNLAADSKPPACHPGKSVPAMTFAEPSAGGGDLCGSLHDDNIKVTDANGPANVWGGPGDDFFDAQNR